MLIPHFFHRIVSTVCTIYILTVAHTYFFHSLSFSLCWWCCKFAFFIDLSVIMQKRKLCWQQSFHTCKPYFSSYYWWNTVPFCCCCCCFGFNRWLFFVLGYLIFLPHFNNSTVNFSSNFRPRKCYINCVYAKTAITAAAAAAWVPTAIYK